MGCWRGCCTHAPDGRRCCVASCSLRRRQPRLPATGAFLEAALAALVGGARAAPTRALADEYDALFGGVGKPEVMLYGSHYLSGFLNDRPLAAPANDLAGWASSAHQAMSETGGSHRLPVRGDALADRRRRSWRSRISPASSGSLPATCSPGCPRCAPRSSVTRQPASTHLPDTSSAHSSRSRPRRSTCSMSSRVTRRRGPATVRQTSILCHVFRPKAVPCCGSSLPARRFTRQPRCCGAAQRDPVSIPPSAQKWCKVRTIESSMLEMQRAEQ